MLSAYPKHALNSKKEIGNPLWNERSISRSKPVYLNGRPGGKDNPFHSAIRYPTYDFTLVEDGAVVHSANNNRLVRVVLRGYEKDVNTGASTASCKRIYWFSPS